MAGNLKFLQINLHRSPQAAALLKRKIVREGVDIALIQEPHTWRGSIRGLNVDRGNLFFDETCSRPRAGVLVRDAAAMPLREYFSADQVAVRIRMKEEGSSRDIVVASVYMPFDSTDPPPSENFDRLVRDCATRGWDLVVGCDANSHHTVWGSTDINGRGEALLEYLMDTSLDILNRGKSPTFVNSIRGEVIDLTLCCNRVCADVLNWRVLDDPSLSDHRYIAFAIRGKATGGGPGTCRNPRLTDWESFLQDLKVGLTDFPKRYGNPSEIDLAVAILTQSITRAFHDNCPLKNSGSRDVPWWNEELASLRKRARQSQNRARKTKARRDSETAREAQKRYRTATRLAQKRSWNKFLEELSSIPETARLCRLLAREGPASTGSFKRGDGSYTQSWEEELVELLDKHFPGYTREETSGFSQETSPLLRGMNMDWDTASRVVNGEKVRWAIASFQPFKSPGEDGVFPVLLQKGMEALVGPLIKIFRACIATGYVPYMWCKTRVVFIPKPGRGDYTKAGSFRPISLTSFLLKTLERLVGRHIRDGALARHPLHHRQFAYQPGKSVDTALHGLVFKIEKALNTGQIAGGLFLDIEGAFNWTSTRSIDVGAERLGVDTTTRRWISTMLNSRSLSVSRGDCGMRVSVARGCPQGGVLSPLLWNLVMDGLLRRLEEAGIYAQAYADDLVILITASFADTVQGLMGTALEVVRKWCEETGLSVHPDKMELVLFTRKRKLEGWENPRYLGKELIPKSSVKHLGVILDARLNWAAHLEYARSKACRVIWVTKRICGQTWGIKPGMMRWIYLSVIKPTLLHGAIVWWRRTKQVTAGSRLDRIRALALRSITGAMRTTPISALGTLLGLPSIQVEAEAAAMSTAHRLMLTEDWRGNTSEGHAQAGTRLAKIFPGIEEPRDFTRVGPLFGRRFEVSYPDRSQWEDPKKLLQGWDLVWYTDGSKIGGQIGAGLHLQGSRTKRSYRLEEHCTVFQAEVVAILGCTRVNLERGYVSRKIAICSDSRAALKALENPIIKSLVVAQCRASLVELSARNKVRLYWVPGHSDIPGNEKADELARKGANGNNTFPGLSVGMPQQTVKRSIRDWTVSQLNSTWRQTDGARQSKIFISEWSAKRTEELMQLDRKSVRTVVASLTGHCRLRRHLNLLGLSEETNCRFCEEGEETPFHLICECPALMVRRHRTWNCAFLEKETYGRLAIREILSFLSGLGLTL